MEFGEWSRISVSPVREKTNSQTLTKTTSSNPPHQQLHSLAGSLLRCVHFVCMDNKHQAKTLITAYSRLQRFQTTLIAGSVTSSKSWFTAAASHLSGLRSILRQDGFPSPSSSERTIACQQKALLIFCRPVART